MMNVQTLPDRTLPQSVCIAVVRENGAFYEADLHQNWITVSDALGGRLYGILVPTLTSYAQ